MTWLSRGVLVMHAWAFDDDDVGGSDPDRVYTHFFFVFFLRRRCPTSRGCRCSRPSTSTSTPPPSWTTTPSTRTVRSSTSAPSTTTTKATSSSSRPAASTVRGAANNPFSAVRGTVNGWERRDCQRGCHTTRPRPPPAGVLPPSACDARFCFLPYLVESPP